MNPASSPAPSLGPTSGSILPALNGSRSATSSSLAKFLSPQPHSPMLPPPGMTAATTTAPAASARHSSTPVSQPASVTPAVAAASAVAVSRAKMETPVPVPVVPKQQLSTPARATSATPPVSAPATATLPASVASPALGSVSQSPRPLYKMKRTGRPGLSLSGVSVRGDGAKSSSGSPAVTSPISGRPRDAATVDMDASVSALDDPQPATITSDLLPPTASASRPARAVTTTAVSTHTAMAPPPSVARPVRSAAAPSQGSSSYTTSTSSSSSRSGHSPEADVMLKMGEKRRRDSNGRFSVSAAGAQAKRAKHGENAVAISSRGLSSGRRPGNGNAADGTVVVSDDENGTPPVPRAKKSVGKAAGELLSGNNGTKHADLASDTGELSIDSSPLPSSVPLPTVPAGEHLSTTQHEGRKKRRRRKHKTSHENPPLHAAPVLDESSASDDLDEVLTLTHALTHAPSGRYYKKWTGKSLRLFVPLPGHSPYEMGNIISASGAILPDLYKQYSNPSLPWICPIRSCRVLFPTLTALGHHFPAGHRATMLNDNLDGTLTVLRKVLHSTGPPSGARVVSQRPLRDNDPLVEPRPTKVVATSNAQEAHERLGFSSPPDVLLSYHDTRIGKISDLPRYRSNAKMASNSNSRNLNDLTDSNDSGESGESSESSESSDGDKGDDEGDSQSLAVPNLPRQLSQKAHTELSAAPSGRPYTKWFDGTPSHGTPFPDEYELSSYPGHPWICPVRDCQRVLKAIHNLGSHFTRSHRNLAFNDNRDGTLSMVGRHKMLRPTIVSQIRRSASELGPLQPPLPPGPPHAINAPPAKAAGTPGIPSAPKPSESHEIRGHNVSGRHPAQPDQPDLPEPLPANREVMWAYVKPFYKRTELKTLQKSAYGTFLDLPRLRDLRWKEPWITLNPYLDSQTRDAVSLLVHLTGDYAEEPCMQCQKGKGPYDGCVIVSSKASFGANAAFDSCANCLYHNGNAYCTLKSAIQARFERLFPAVDYELTRRHVRCGKFARDIAEGRDLAEIARTVLAKKEPLKMRVSVGGDGGGYRDRQRDNDSGGGGYYGVRNNELSNSMSLTQADSRRSDRIAIKEAVAAEVAMIDSPARPRPGQSGRAARAHSSRDVGGVASDTLMSAGHALPGPETLEMEDWEVAPGRVQSEGGQENIAFSNAYLTSNQMVPIDHNMSYRVEVVRPGSTIAFPADAAAMRICTLAAGKVRVAVGETRFVIGPHGMFRAKPGEAFTVENRMYVDAYLHVVALRDLA